LEVLLELFFEIFAFDMSFGKMTEKKIERNLTILKEMEWFQKYLRNKEYKELIIYDGDVRKVIGKFRSTTLKKDPNHYRYQKKVHDIIMKKSYQNMP